MSDEIKAWPMDESHQHCVLVNAHGAIALSKRGYKNVPLWSFVSEIIGHGSGYSANICKANDWNPHQSAHLPLTEIAHRRDKARVSTGNAFRDAMANNRGIHSNS